MADSTLTVVAAARAYPGETVSGDAWQVDWHGGACRIAVVDGLGHGPAAAAAAAAALAALAADPALEPTEAVRRCHEALKGTRGAAVLVARIDGAAGRLAYAGVGNVEGRLWQEGRAERMVTDRGTAGAVVPRLHSVELELSTDWLLLLHTDGVSSRFDSEVLAGIWEEPRRIAEAVLARWGRMTDDATVVVACPT